MPKINICQSANYASGELLGIICQQNIYPWMNVQSFRSDRRRYNWLACGHSFEDFQPTPSSNTKWYDECCGLAQIFGYRRNCPSHFDRPTGEPAHSRMRIPANDLKYRIWDFRKHAWPDIAVKEFDAVNIRSPVHGTEENHILSRRNWRGSIAVLLQIYTRRTNTDSRGIGHLCDLCPVLFRNYDDVMESPNGRGFIAEHFGRFESKGFALEPVRFVLGLPSPEHTLHIVLEENRGCIQLARKVQ